MPISLERAANVIDRKGVAVLQGIFPGTEFDHLVGRVLEMEKKEPLREQVIWTIYDISCPDHNQEDEERFIQVMSQAVEDSRGRQRKGRIKLMGEFEGSFVGDSIKIYSRPKIEGIRMVIREPILEYITTTVIDLTHNSVHIKIRRGTDKFKKKHIHEFLQGNYNPEDIQGAIESVTVQIGHDLDEAIFRQRRGFEGGEN